MPRVKRSVGRIALAIALGGAILPVPGWIGIAASEPKAPPRDIFREMADEVSDQVLASSAFQAKLAGGRKARIVIGDVRNNSDDESIRVEDVFNEIRNRIVAAGTARLFAPGELEADLIIAPELTSNFRSDKNRRLHCYTLQLTLTTVSGEYVAAHSAFRC